MKLKRILPELFFFSLAFLCASQEQVDFYATVSSSGDQSMIKMTTDLFYTKFLIVDGYVINDKRSENYDPSKRNRNISFYAEIEEQDGGWICTLNAVKERTSQSVSLTKKYDSYYKILLDAKPSLENLMHNLSGEETAGSNVTPDNQPQITTLAHATLDAIAGTWAGEDLIEKVLILRSGRGFVIYKNGASMNVSVTTDGNNVNILQKSEANASFFPEIPRDDALKNAGSANPIEWNLTFTGNTLFGKKTTLIANKDSPSGFSMGQLDVRWVRQ